MAQKTKQVQTNQAQIAAAQAANTAAAEKKARQLTRYPENEFKKKLGQFLQRRGFHYALIKEIMDELWQETEDKFAS